MLYYVRLFEGRTGRAIASVSEPSEPQWSPEPGIVVPRYETHLRYDDKRRELIGDLDYIVVGSGCGGSVVAHELQKAGKRVLVIEAGSFFVPGTYDARAGLDFYEARGLRTTADGGIFVLNGEAVGGGGTINVDMAFPPTLPIIAARVERWRALGLIPDDLWTPEELQRAADWTARQFGTRHVRADEINAHNRLLLEGGRARGLAPERYHLNTYAPGESPLRRSDKRGPVDALLMPAMSAAERPVTLLPDARVLRVLMESGVAVGVELETHAPHDKPGVVADPSGLRIPRGTKLSVRARQVVLAAGNLGSSALLLRSRIGHPEIGRGFVMHPFLLLIGEFKQRIDGHSGLSSSIYASDFITTDFSRKAPDFLLEVAAARPEVCAAMCPGPASQVHRMVQRYRSLGGIGVVLLDEPSPHNRVGIDARGKARVFYRLSESDKQRLRNGIVESGKILFEAGAERILMPSFEAKAAADGYQGIVEHPEQLTTMTDELEFRTNQTPLFGAHMMSGNKLAVAPELGVVTPEYEVRGARGLYLVDASIFPSSIGANPMQSIYGVAKIFCDRHLARS
jgi:choline dehydrogenase-like flavoprotein